MPERDVGAMVYHDDDQTARSVVLDRADRLFWELATVRRDTAARPSYSDKRNLAGVGTSIALEHWGKQHTVGPAEKHKKLEDDMSHLYVEPQYPDRRGDDGYDEAGLRDGQTFGMDVYADGELVTPDASATRVLATGDTTFSGSKVQARKLQYVAKASQSEVQFTGIQHSMVAKETMGSRTERSTGEMDAQAELYTYLVYWLTRNETILYERVSGVTLSGTAVRADGPDGRTDSAFTTAAIISLQNEAVTDLYAHVFWGDGLSDGFTQYGDVYDGWTLQYRQGAGGLPANMSLPAGNYFDIRIYAKTLSMTAIAELYNNTIRQAGRGVLPVF